MKPIVYRRRLCASLALVAVLSAVSWSAAAQPLQVVKVGATPGVTADAVQALVPEGKRHGLDIQLVEFTDWTLPNEAVNNRDIDLNFFQHQAFLNHAIKERGYALELIGLGLLQNIGLYSERHPSLAELPRKSKVALANDPVNQGRGLLLLQQAGLIKLRQGAQPGARLDDVIDNPQQLQFFEIEGPQLIHALPDVDLAVVWPSYFVNAGKQAQAAQALLYSGVDDRFYAMGFVARSDRAQEAKLRKFVAIYQQSAEVRRVIAQGFDGNASLYTLPWLP
jgi:D-methionine transport system substrate-binding protein